MFFTKISLFVLANLALGNGDTFTSIREMENLFDLEQNLVKALDNYLRHANFELEVMELHYEELSKIESEITDIEKYAENPVNAYSAIKRMHYEWPVTFKLMSNSPFFEEEPTFPDKSVLLDAISHLVQWQIKNKLNAKTLAQGQYEGIMPHANLTAGDCLEIAVYCYNNKQKKLAVEWLEEALTKIQNDAGSSAQLLVRVLEYTFLTKCLTDDVKGSVAAFQSLLTDGAYWYTPLDELKKDYQLDKVKKCEASAKKALKTKKTKSTSLFKHYDRSHELCHSARRPTKEMSCYLRFDFNTFRPIRVELISTSPLIQLVHGFLTNDMLLDIKESSLNEFTTLRMGLNGPVPLPNKDLAGIVDKRLRTIMGFDSKMLSEDKTIYVQGPGAQYIPFNNLKTKDEHQFAVAYYFLSDVARGGNVVFPSVKVSLEPTKGSLLLWLDSDGKLEVGECPVFVGSKWVLSHSIVQMD